MTLRVYLMDKVEKEAQSKRNQGRLRRQRLDGLKYLEKNKYLSLDTALTLILCFAGLYLGHYVCNFTYTNRSAIINSFTYSAVIFEYLLYFRQWRKFGPIQSSSVVQSCLILCNPMDCSAPGFPVYHQLPELAQTHVRQVSDAVQPSHPLSSPSPPAFNLSQHQGLFQWVSSLHQVAKVLVPYI